MLQILLGIAAGVCTPAQTSVNTRMRQAVGSPFYSAFISLLEGWIFLMALLFILDSGITQRIGVFWEQPLWAFTGGVFGVIFLTGNIILFPKLGSVQTVVLPVLGQIMAGLIIDSFGFFRAEQIPMTWTRIIGAVLVFGGVVAVSLASNPRKAGDTGQADGTGGKVPGAGGAGIWIYRFYGIFIGMCSATQTSINGYVGRLLSSPIASSFISFTVSIAMIAVVVAALLIRSRGAGRALVAHNLRTGPFWMWFGGVLGATFVLANVYLVRILGTGMTVVVTLVGITGGGLIIDHFGLFEAQIKKMNIAKVLGVAVMIVGVILIRLV